MTTAGLLTALALECPNGISFEPMALRLLRHKVFLEDWQIKDLKTVMFQAKNGLWFSRSMILNNDSLLTFEKQIKKWLTDYGYFSITRLVEDFRAIFRHISTSEDCANFIRYLGFEIAIWGKECYFCTLPSLKLEDALVELSALITERLEEAGGALALQEILKTIPHMTLEIAENIRMHFLPEVHKVEIGGMPCWCNTETLPLPDDFGEKLTSIVATLNELKEKVSVAKLEFSLNLFYRIRFREEYALLDNDTFMHICNKHYHGGNTIFKSARKKRARNPNTRFCDLGVPIGAELVFTRDSEIICTVSNDCNKVKYNGNIWAISTLATYLLGGVSANGFSLFSYKGETLWERRLRLEQENTKKSKQTVEILHPQKAQEEKSKIIGLSGKVLSRSTWQAFKRDGTNPRVAEWAYRAEKGESMEQIAWDTGYAVPTLKGMISNYRLYFKVCELNGIEPSGGTDV